jgi:hypothetical protein
VKEHAMQTHLPWKELGYVLGSLVLLLALYVGAYFGTVTRANDYASVTETVVEPRQKIVDGVTVTYNVAVERTATVLSRSLVATYPELKVLGTDATRSFFAPIHAIDRVWRDSYWEDQIVLPEPRGFGGKSL